MRWPPWLLGRHLHEELVDRGRALATDGLGVCGVCKQVVAQGAALPVVQAARGLPGTGAAWPDEQAHLVVVGLGVVWIVGTAVVQLRGDRCPLCIDRAKVHGQAVVHAAGLRQRSATGPPQHGASQQQAHTPACPPAGGGLPTWCYWHESAPKSIRPRAGKLAGRFTTHALPAGRGTASCAPAGGSCKYTRPS